jgi:hypothetical protein
MSAVVNRAASARLYECALSFPRRLFLPRADSIELLVGRRVSVTGALTKRAGMAAGNRSEGVSVSSAPAALSLR